MSDEADLRLSVVEVRKSYRGRVALDGVSLEVSAGEILGLLGPNGAGKTTLVSIVAGLRRPDAGLVQVGPIDVVANPRAVHSMVGLAPQETAVYEVLTVRENLIVFGELAGLRRRPLVVRIDEVGAALRLGHLMDRVAHQLSGGERRRLHTAIALLGRPALLLLDEPTVGADVDTRAALVETVRALAREGSGIVYSTHYLPEVESLGASVVILVAGRVIASGRVDELIARHGHATAELVFDGPAPYCNGGCESVMRDDDVLRITSREPAVAAASVISRLGADTHRLRAVELLRPSLDSVFLTLTGRRYDAEGRDGVAAA